MVRYAEWSTSNGMYPNYFFFQVNIYDYSVQFENNYTVSGLCPVVFFHIGKVCDPAEASMNGG